MSSEWFRLVAAAELAEGGATRMPPTDQQWLSPVGLRAAADSIEWMPRESIARGGIIMPSEGLLEDFLALKDADADQVVRFAEQHGVLGLSSGLWFRQGDHATEPLSEWHQAVDRAAAILHAAAKIRDGRTLTDAERVPVLRAAWPDVAPEKFTGRQLYLDGEPFNEPVADEDEGLRVKLLAHSNRSLDDERAQLTWAVTTWMQQAGAQLVLTWPAGAREPLLTIGGERPQGCLPAIAVQVALACSRADTTRVCDGCGGLHAPKRQPKPGQRSFCQACRAAGVPVKLANRDRRARTRNGSSPEGAEAKSSSPARRRNRK